MSLKAVHPWLCPTEASGAVCRQHGEGRWGRRWRRRQASQAPSLHVSDQHSQHCGCKRQWAVQEGSMECSPTRRSWLLLLLFSYADASGGIVGCKTFLGAVQLAVATVQPATGGAS